MTLLNQLVRDMNRKIERQKERAILESSARPLSVEDKARLDAIKARHTLPNATRSCDHLPLRASYRRKIQLFRNCDCASIACHTCMFGAGPLHLLVHCCVLTCIWVQNVCFCSPDHDGPSYMSIQAGILLCCATAQPRWCMAHQQKHR